MFVTKQNLTNSKNWIHTKYVLHNTNELEIRNKDNKKISKHLEIKQHTNKSFTGQKKKKGNLKVVKNTLYWKKLKPKILKFGNDPKPIHWEKFLTLNA